MHGSPCQDFSLAGKQAGGDKDSGTRSSLMYETIRIVEKLKPKYVIWENVKNLLSKKHRHNFDAYLQTMEELGYTNYYRVLNAKDYGIPQNRERVFTVSILGNENYEFPNKENEANLQDFLEKDTNVKTKPMCEKAFNKEYEQIITSDKEIYQCNVSSGYQDCKVGIKVSPTIRAGNNCTHILQRFEFSPKQELKLKLKDMLEDEVDEKYYLSDKQLNYVLDMKDVALKSGRDINDRIVNPQIAKTISCRGAVDQRADVTNFTIDECDEELKVKDIKKMSLLIKNSTKKGYLEAVEGDGVDVSGRMQYHRGTVQKQMIQTLTTSGGNDRGVVVDKLPGAYGRDFGSKGKIQNKEYCDTLTASMGNGGGNVPIYQKELRIRKLTPKECWRLMGFDDEDFEKSAKVNSNTQLYKQAGNSIVVNVLEAILNSLLNQK